MVLNLLLAPITAPVHGLAWMGNQILERANAELDDTENLHKRLLALQLAFDMGDIEEEDFEEQEEELLLAIEALAEQEAAEAKAEAEE